MRPVTVDAARVANAFDGYAAPDHQASTTIFDRALDILLCELAAFPPPRPIAPIGSYKVDFGLIRKEDAIPVLYGPVPISRGKGKALADMPRQKSRFFFLCPAFSPASFSARRVVLQLTFTLVVSLSCRVAWTALAALPEVILRTSQRLSVAVSLAGRPARHF